MISTNPAGAPPPATIQTPPATAFFDAEGLDPDVQIPWFPISLVDGTATKDSPEVHAEWAIQLDNGDIWSRTAAARGERRRDGDPDTLFATREAAARERARLVSLVVGAGGALPQNYRPVLVVRAVFVGTDGTTHVQGWEVAERGGLDSIAEAVGL